MADIHKVLVNLTTGLEDVERVKVSDFFANGRAERPSWQDDGKVLRRRAHLDYLRALQRVARGVLADVC
jgi:hypothetical protein